MGHEKHNVAVLGPVLYLTVTVELSSAETDEVHIHPGGQGFWVARMLKHLDERPLLCGPIGGEAGKVFLGLLGQFGMDVSPVEIAHHSPVLISDRRSGERKVVANSPTVSLERHEIDDLYGRFLDGSLSAGISVVTGQSEEILPVEFFRRLGHDLASSDVQVVADLHGPELWSFLEGGPIDVLKVSHDDLRTDGLLGTGPATEEALFEAVGRLVEAGARAVVLSRQHEPTLACFGNTWCAVHAPELDPADHRGAGDSMTAGLAAALLRGLGQEDTLRLAAAAGAANVTRHGLGSADAELIPALTSKVEVDWLSPAPA